MSNTYTNIIQQNLTIAVNLDAKLHPRGNLMKIELFIRFQLQTQVSHPKPLDFLLQKNLQDETPVLLKNVVSRPFGAQWKRRQAFVDEKHFCKVVFVFTFSQICTAFIFN